MARYIAFVLVLALLLAGMPGTVSVAVEPEEGSAPVTVSQAAGTQQTLEAEETVAEETGPRIILSYATVSFEGAIEYNIYYTVQDMDGVSVDDMGLALFETEQSDGTVDTAYQVTAGAVTDGVRYMVATEGIPAKNLGDTVYFRVYARLGDGSYVYSDIKPYSLRIYADSVLEKSTNENMKTLVAQTLHYGASAQLYFGYKTDALMDYCIAPNEHTYEDVWTVETAATLTGDGRQYRLCTVCGKGKQTQVIPQLTVDAVAVTTLPDRLAYYTGETFDPTGMVVTATLSDGTTMEVTDYTVDKTVLTAEDTVVTVSYGELTATVQIAVSGTVWLSVGQLAEQADGENFLVEGYFVGVAEEGASSDKELLMKDLHSDDVIAVRDVSFGSFPDYGYQTGDRIRILATVQTDGTVNTPDKRYLAFSSENGAIEDTIVSTGNVVTYSLTDVVEVGSWEEMQALFALDTIREYSFIRLTGTMWINRYLGSDGVDVSRVHMNGAATGVSGIRTDGSKTVSLRDDVMAANLGQDWYELFFDEIPAAGSYPGKELEGTLVAMYTGGNNYYYQLTVLDESWVQLSEYDNADVVLEVADAFYRQGTQIQYDQTQSRRNIDASPEDATAYRTLYMDCSSFVNATYKEAFGVNVMDSTKMPSTANYTSYAVSGLGTQEDVIGYWVNADYTSAEQIAAVLAQVRGQLQVGDVLVYRHGQTSGSSGHVYIYLGEDTFIHCTGSSYYYADTPSGSYDKGTTAEKTGGAVQLIAADDIFVDTTHTRYLFKVTDSDSVFDFALLRPLARGLTPTEGSQARMRLRGVDLEKTVDAGPYGAVEVGDNLTYTVTLTNGSSQDQTRVTVSEVLGSGLTFLSGSEGVTASGQTISWTGDVAAGATVTVSYTVQVGSDAGSVIESSGMLVGGVGINDLTNTVSSYTDAALTAVADQADSYASAGEAFADPIALVRVLYPGVVDGYATVQDALSDLIDTTNKTCSTDTAIASMLVPDLYGGLDIKSGFTKDNRRIRLVTEDHLEVGDVILAEYGDESVVFVYTGEGTLVTIDSTGGVCSTVTITGDAFSCENILVTLIAYDRFAVLRPSMVG